MQSSYLMIHNFELSPNFLQILVMLQQINFLKENTCLFVFPENFGMLRSELIAIVQLKKTDHNYLLSIL